MAFTKITNAGFGLTTGTLVGVAASFSSTVSVGGTLTYEDVTNVDSVGLITARNGIQVSKGGGRNWCIWYHYRNKFLRKRS